MTDKMKQVGINFNSKTIKEISDIIGYGSRSAFIRDLVAASLDCRDVAIAAGEHVKPHELPEWVVQRSLEYAEGKAGVDRSDLDLRVIDDGDED